MFKPSRRNEVGELLGGSSGGKPRSENRSTIHGHHRCGCRASGRLSPGKVSGEGRKESTGSSPASFFISLRLLESQGDGSCELASCIPMHLLVMEPQESYPSTKPIDLNCFLSPCFAGECSKSVHMYPSDFVGSLSSGPFLAPWGSPTATRRIKKIRIIGGLFWGIPLILVEEKEKEQARRFILGRIDYDPFPFPSPGPPSADEINLGLYHKISYHKDQAVALAGN